MQILVVDDNADGAHTLARLLQLYGHEAHVALGGPQALQVARDRPPDVVLLDLAMPQMDGYELAKRLREQLTPRRFKLAALTGYGQGADHARSQAEGFDQHFAKPIDPAELHAWLQRLALSEHDRCALTNSGTR